MPSGTPGSDSSTDPSRLGQNRRPEQSHEGQEGEGGQSLNQNKSSEHRSAPTTQTASNTATTAAPASASLRSPFGGSSSGNESGNAGLSSPPLSLSGTNLPNDVALPLSLIRALRGKRSGNGDSESNESSGGGDSGENNSDNSALVSLGNTSFGFNFDSEEGAFGNNSAESKGSSSARNRNRKYRQISQGKGRQQGSQAALSEKPATRPNPAAGVLGSKSSVSDLTTSSSLKSKDVDMAQERLSNLGDSQNASTTTSTTANSPPPAPPQASQSSPQPSATNLSSSALYNEAAAAAVASLHSIASACSKEKSRQAGTTGGVSTKRKFYSGSGGDSDDSNADHHASTTSSDGQTFGGGKKKNKLNDFKREERNAREKERSFRISRQINELRDLLSSGGVIVPKGTKSSVLTEAANYIRMLQQHQYRSEIDRHQLVQQIQMIGGGALGQPAATAIRHVAAQNGVWSLGNFGGVPPKSALMYHQPGTDVAPSTDPDATDNSVLPSKIETDDYRYVFNSSAVGMAIASMGGAFIDCNHLFCQLSDYTKQEICSMTIFNLTARQDLQHAFDLISQMLSGGTADSGHLSSCSLRGALKSRTDLGLNVSLIKGEDGVAKCFCCTLISNPSGATTSERLSPATAQYVQAPQMQGIKADEAVGLGDSPTYTAG